MSYGPKQGPKRREEAHTVRFGSEQNRRLTFPFVFVFPDEADVRDGTWKEEKRGGEHMWEGADQKGREGLFSLVPKRRKEAMETSNFRRLSFR